MKPKNTAFAKQFTAYGLLFFAFLLVMTSLVSHTPAPEPTDTPLRQAAEPDKEAKGTVVIDMPIQKGRYLIRDLMTDKNIAGANEVGSLSIELPAGDYEITFGRVFGYITPPAQRFTVVPGATAVVKGDYNVAVAAPTLNVKVAPEEGKYRIYNEQKRVVKEAEGSGFYNFPAGRYFIEFLPIPGYQSPGKSTFLLKNCVTTTLTTNYKPANQ